MNSSSSWVRLLHKSSEGSQHDSEKLIQTIGKMVEQTASDYSVLILLIHFFSRFSFFCFIALHHPVSDDE